MCDGCGTVVRIEKIMRLNVSPPQFCPYCGHRGVKAVKSSFAAIDAPCFVGMPPAVLEYLWHEWALKPGTHTTLLSYVRARLQSAARKVTA